MREALRLPSLPDARAWPGIVGYRPVVFVRGREPAREHGSPTSALVAAAGSGDRDGSTRFWEDAGAVCSRESWSRSRFSDAVSRARWRCWRWPWVGLDGTVLRRIDRTWPITARVRPAPGCWWLARAGNLVDAKGLAMKTVDRPGRLIDASTRSSTGRSFGWRLQGRAARRPERRAPQARCSGLGPVGLVARSGTPGERPWGLLEPGPGAWTAWSAGWRFLLTMFATPIVAFLATWGRPGSGRQRRGPRRLGRWRRWLWRSTSLDAILNPCFLTLMMAGGRRPGRFQGAFEERPRPPGSERISRRWTPQPGQDVGRRPRGWIDGQQPGCLRRSLRGSSGFTRSIALVRACSARRRASLDRDPRRPTSSCPEVRALGLPIGPLAHREEGRSPAWILLIAALIFDHRTVAQGGQAPMARPADDRLRT